MFIIRLKIVMCENIVGGLNIGNFIQNQQSPKFKLLLINSSFYTHISYLHG